MLSTIRLLLLTIIILYTVPVMAKIDTFIVLSDATWPPLEYLDENKNVIGYSIDYIKAVAKEANFNIEIRNTPWDGIFSALYTDQNYIISSSVTVTDKRKQKIIDVSEPYYEVQQAIVIPFHTSIQSIDDLTGKKIGGQIGTTGLIETLPKTKVNVIPKAYDEIGLAFKDLAKGNIDAVICDNPVAQYYITRKPEYAKKFKIGLTTPDVEYYAFAVRKGNHDIINRINHAIQLIKEKGLDTALKNKWFHTQ